VRQDRVLCRSLCVISAGGSPLRLARIFEQFDTFIDKPRYTPHTFRAPALRLSLRASCYAGDD
jgi:hypothetical protein